MIDDPEVRARVLFSRMGRKQKLALAVRDGHAVRKTLEGLDHAVLAAILVKCDAFAARNRAKGRRLERRVGGRSGSGRPPLGDAGRRVTKTIKLTPGELAAQDAARAATGQTWTAWVRAALAAALGDGPPECGAANPGGVPIAPQIEPSELSERSRLRAVARDAAVARRKQNTWT